MSAVSATEAVPPLALPAGHDHLPDPPEPDVVSPVEHAAEATAAITDEPNAGLSTAETVSDEVAAALAGVHDAGSPTVGIDEALAEYHATNPE
ncbi:hypothetical protein [Aureimonas glaciei]|uniref:Uncharacterized protein n=1 Tax=Aureimonas glaciei TaxID=1776957 RepID=A0A917DET9_9HYPH|nr:hypothetical protein [Aureimonas glaciei]GGD32337.1 hypothetical protein GCM10011335_39250 [Aureimonas glaciei]